MAKVESKCLCCGEPFLTHQCELRRGGGKFCSRKCATIYRNTHDNPAKKEEVRAKISGNHANVSGEKNPMFMRRGAAAPAYKDGRNSFKGEKYRKMLLASGRTQECEVCKTTSNLCVHHIDGDHNNNVLDNLMCVCYKCHNSIKHHHERDKNGRFVDKNKLKEVM